MNAGRRLGALAAWAARRARVVLVLASLLAVGAGVGATRLDTDAGADTLLDADTAAYRATQAVRERFGEEPVVVLAKGDLQRLVLTGNLVRLLRLEGCLSGNVPEGSEPLPGPCAELARLDSVLSVAGPATFLNEAAIQIERQLRRLARGLSPAELRQLLLVLAARYGITSPPSLSNPEFIAAVVFDLRRARGTPKARLSHLFPNRRSAQILVRLRPGLSEEERHRAIELVRAAVFDDTPREACRFRGAPEPCFQLRGGSYVVSGVPVVVDGVTRALKDALLLLLAVAVVVMALTLTAVFRTRLRLLPLALALAAAALTFGLLAAAGGALTMASIAVLPILVGLAVDYAIQLHARHDEAVAAGARGPDAARFAAAGGGPTIAVACLATVAGFAALQLSPTPMVRGFGLLLLAGILIAFPLALLAGFAALSLSAERIGLPVFSSLSSGGRRRGGVSSAARKLRSRGSVPLIRLKEIRAAKQREGQGRAPHPDGRTRPPERCVNLALAHPGRVLGVGFAIAVLGWGVGTQVRVQSDIVELAPQDVRAVREVKELQEVTGVSGQLDVLVRAGERLTDPETIRWMDAFKRRALRSGGFSGPEASCLQAELCPGPALSDLLTAGGGRLTERSIRRTLSLIPAYNLRQLAQLDPETGQPSGAALLSFGIRAQSLDRQGELIERVREAVGEPGTPAGPPPGVEVEPAGLPVLAAAAASELSGSRYLLTLAGLAAVAAVLLAVYRSPARALVPVLPIVLATGWGSLLLWASGIPLNPMSAALGALTIAIVTEFSVILAGRFREERRRGLGVPEALRSAYSRTGAAVLASGATAIAGFAVLLASDVRMLREFAAVTVIDLGVALLGVMVVLPAALVRMERR